MRNARFRLHRFTLLSILACSFLLNTAVLADTGFSAATTPVTSFTGFKGVVVGDACNLRSGPGTQYESTGLVLEGTWLDVVSAEDDWLKITYKNEEAWIASWLVDIDLNSSNLKAVIAKNDVNIRQGPGTDLPVIGTVQQGQSYPAEAKRGQWVRVFLGNNKTGWISESLLQLQLPAIDDSDIIPRDMAVRPRAQNVVVYQSPIKGSGTIATLTSSDSARYITSRGAWIAVQTQTGAKGWVYGPDTVISSLKDTGLSFGISESSWSLGKYSTITVNATDVNLRAGPGTTYPVISMVQKDDTMRVLETQDQWTRGISPKGVVGWVASWLTKGAPNQSPGFSIALDASSATRTLTIQGPFETCGLTNIAEAVELVITTSADFKTSGFLDINSFEFENVRVEGNKVTIKFREQPSYIIKEQSPGKLVLGFVPKITAVNLHPAEDGEILTIESLGFIWPDMARNGSFVNMFLPGASYAGETNRLSGNLLGAVSISSDDDGVGLLLDASQSSSYLLKKNANSIEAVFSNPGLRGKVIVLDPGHGGSDPGATGPTGYNERIANWEIAIRLKELLESAGAQVILTRLGIFENAPPPEDWSPDIDEYGGDLAKRAAWSSQAHAFVSIHNDANSDKNMCGTTTYLCPEILNASESRRLAELVQKSVTHHLGTVNKGVREANFFVNRESHCPSVLVEVMYLSNSREEGLLKQENIQSSAAQGIFRALEQYFSPAAPAAS